MEKEALRVWFDPKGDFLEVGLSRPRKGFFKDVGEDVFVRVDEKGNVMGFAIFNVTKRMEKVREMKLPVKASFSKMKKATQR